MPWKLYVDSRKRVAGARADTDSDFAIQLPYPIEVSGKAYVDVVLLSNTYNTIRTGENDRIYLDENSAQTKRVATLAAGQYNVFELRDALVAALNAGKAITGSYQVTYLVTQNRFQIHLVSPASTDQFRIWQEEHLKAQHAAWAGVATLAADDLRSANRPCGFLRGTIISGNSTEVATAPNAPDVQPYKQLFIRSSLGGGSNESLGVNGETDIIRRIVVGNTPANAMIHDVHSTPLDCVKINGTPELNTIWFQLVDVEGRVVDTHGHPVSFSIIFVDVEE
jgi:hypothetical protein